MRNSKLEKYLSGISCSTVSRAENEMRMRVENLHASAINALRRTILSDTPSLAIEWVLIKENTSPMADEILAHRLGLLPIFGDPEAFGFLDQEERESSHFDPLGLTEKKSIKFAINIKNKTRKVLSVYSNDISTEQAKATIKPGILLTRLAPGQAIEAKLIAIKGVGRDHAKWSPVSICTYRLVKTVQFHGSAEDLQGVEKYFRAGLGVDESSHGTSKFCVDENNLSVNSDVLCSKYSPHLTLSTLPSSYIFDIETISRAPEGVLAQGLHVLHSKCINLLRQCADIDR